jgi:hypothetical protein
MVRQLLAELDLYRQEDQPIMRELYSLGAKHSCELREAEELGYARGLKDGQIYLARQPLPQDIVEIIQEDLKSGLAERHIARTRHISHSRVRSIHRKMKPSLQASGTNNATPATKPTLPI